jgi:hypothetical protein
MWPFLQKKKKTKKTLKKEMTSTEVDAHSRYWMDHMAPNEGARESTKEAKGICKPIGGTTL